MPDLKNYANQTQKRLIIGFLILVSTVGLFLILVIYGLPAALTGFICLGSIFLVIGVVLLVLKIIEKTIGNE